VEKITHSAQLLAYASAVFGGQQKNDLHAKNIANTWQTRAKFLVEAFIGNANKTSHFFETTTGLLTHVGPANETIYEIFEPSEVLAAAGILSLEEKFLAGEGHNITPVRLHADPLASETMRKQVRNELERVAKALNIQGYARIDAFVQVDAQQHTTVWIIEINALPALTPATCIFHQSALNGYTPLAFLEAIISYGCTKKNFSRRH
jgi:D-alanine-D-alanine ligase